MRMLKSIISVFLAVAIASVSFVPAYAVDPGLIVDGAAVAPSFFDWVIGSMQSFGNWANSYFIEDVCRGAGATENSRHVFDVQYTTVGGKFGLYYICKNCGLSAGEASQPAYEEEVSKLPAQGYNSDGLLYVTLSHGFFAAAVDVGSSTNSYYYCEHSSRPSYSDKTHFSCNFDCANNSFALFPSSGRTSFYTRGFYCEFSCLAPIDGIYHLQPGIAFSGYVRSSSGERFDFSRSISEGSSFYFSAGDKISRTFYDEIGKTINGKYLDDVPLIYASVSCAPIVTLQKWKSFRVTP